MRRAARLFLVLALSLSIGLQWALVQGVGWMQMVVSFAREVSIVESVAMTLDGKHPCRLCKAAQGGETGMPAKKTVVVKQLDPAEPEDGLVMFAAEHRTVRTCFVVAAKGETRLRPPSPPPRFQA